MKKSVYTLLMSCLVCLSLYAVYDEPIKVLRIFNGGVGTTIQLSHVDSLMHSRYDADSIKQSDYLQSVIYSLDSIYNIPTASIDSIVVEDVDVEEYKSHIISIEEYIGQQEELAVEPFQNNLLAWLNAQEWVDHAVINDGRDFITVTMDNGIEFYVSFHDTSFLEESDELQSVNLPAYSNKVEECYDVSYQEGDDIIRKPDILYIQGRTMPSPGKRSTAIEEQAQLLLDLNSSPVNGKLTFISKSLSFLQENISEYGVVIVSQTHGANNLHGAFQVEDLELWNSPELIGCRGFSYPVQYNEIVKENAGDGTKIFWIKPELGKRIIANSSVAFGGFCFSNGIYSDARKGSFMGYVTVGEYYKNTAFLNKLMANLFNGKSFKDAASHILDMFLFDTKDKEGKDIKKGVVVNKTKTHDRYFSISTKDVTDFAENGNAIVKGTINGYENLKKTGVNYYAYVFGKGEELNYADIATGKPFTPNPDGSFSYECTDLPETEGNEYQVVIGFTYAGKTYYGEVKTFEVDNHLFCPDGNHPHIIDLGIGTKWACCNVGAHSPEEYGGYYAWGETSEKSVYSIGTYKYGTVVYNSDPSFSYDVTFSFQSLGSDISGTGYDVAHIQWGGSWCMPTHDEINALLQKCSSVWTLENGVYGLRVTGPSGGSIFLPAAGFREYRDLKNAGSLGLYSSSTQSPRYSGDAYGLHFYSGRAYLDGFRREYGQSVRPVIRN